jgi:hypothetical protein
MASTTSESRAPLAGDDPAQDVSRLRSREVQDGPAAEPGQDDQPLIAVIPKSAREEIRVHLRLYKGHRFVDLRLFAHDGSGMVPTKAGITLRFAALRAVAAALIKSHDEAIRLGYVAEAPRAGEAT